MIRGAIDSVRKVGGGGFALSGWAAVEKGKNRSPADFFSIEGLGNCEFIRVNRRDFKEHGDFGFIATIPDLKTLASIYYGSARLLAHFDKEAIEVKLWDRIKQNVLALILEESVCDFPDEALFQLFRVMMRPKGRLSTAGDYSEVSLEVGAQSYDGTIVVGRAGYFFLYGGSNRAHDQYSSLVDEGKLAKWCSVIKDRAIFCKAQNVQFLQLIVPEKQSVLRTHYPFEISSPTPFLASLCECFKNEPFFINAYAELADSFVRDGLSPFRKVDSHLSLHGAMALIKGIARKIGKVPDIWPVLLEEKVLGGDLGIKFMRGNIVEKVLMPVFEEWPFYKVSPTLERSIDSTQGHGGTLRQWRCDSPVYDKEAIIFGNSVFERGGGPLGLSWWASRMFRRTTFVWSSQLDKQLVEELKPDVVICQTVERFLTTVPNA